MITKLFGLHLVTHGHLYLTGRWTSGEYCRSINPNEGFAFYSSERWKKTFSQWSWVWFNSLDTGHLHYLHQQPQSTYQYAGKERTQQVDKGTKEWVLPLLYVWTWARKWTSTVYSAAKFQVRASPQSPLMMTSALLISFPVLILIDVTSVGTTLRWFKIHCFVFPEWLLEVMERQEVALDTRLLVQLLPMTFTTVSLWKS